MSQLHILHLGRIRYADAFAFQQRVVALRREKKIGDTLLLLEHEPVITLGRNAHRENILVGDEVLTARGIELYETNRGGDVTFHGPGQLVGYPIIDLRGDFPQKRGPYLGPVDYVRLLEEILMRVCGDFGVATKRITGCTGVWTVASPERKLAAIGVHVSVGITSHGFALNVANDLSGFASIIPCGISTRGVTSLQVESNAQTAPNLSDVGRSVGKYFAETFAYEISESISLEALLSQEELVIAGAQ